jgi:hypothetical protein
MSVREIKELVMRTASRLEQAEQLLRGSLIAVVAEPNQPYFSVGMIPLFFEDFLVDVRDPAVHRAIAEFGRSPQPDYFEPTYSFDGLERRERSGYVLRFYRNGLLSAGSPVPLIQAEVAEARHVVTITAFDILLRRFVMKASTVFERAKVGAPYVLGMMLRNTRPLIGRHAGPDGFPYDSEAIPILEYRFPFVQVDDLSNVDNIIRPLCDQIHQTFGLRASLNFNAEGVWIGR